MNKTYTESYSLDRMRRAELTSLEHEWRLVVYIYADRGVIDGKPLHHDEVFSSFISFPNTFSRQKMVRMYNAFLKTGALPSPAEVEQAWKDHAAAADGKEEA